MRDYFGRESIVYTVMNVVVISSSVALAIAVFIDQFIIPIFPQ